MHSAPNDAASDRLIEEAVDLIMLMQDQSGDPEISERIRLWRTTSGQHDAVWRKVAGIYDASGLLLEARQRNERRESLFPTRRNFLIGGLAFTGAGIWGYDVVPDLWLSMQADHITRKGQLQEISLPGGAHTTLGPNSAITLRSHDLRSELELLSGMAFVDHTRDWSAEVSLVARDVNFEVERAKLDLSLDSGSIYLSVAEGRVTLSPVKDRSRTIATLGAGQWLSYEPRHREIEFGARAVDEIANWRDGQLIARNDPVGVLIDRISRWYTGRVIQADPRMNATRISGIFDLSDPISALSAVVRPAGGHLRTLPGGLVLISPV
ncbi:FecR family protein [Tritonibacter mobilis]|uniref:FecR family protein n=1 Tax=Tritonibacter mobilis TaxID=379347 RepID=UPI000E0DCB9D|nr:FecR domain-containing protein [Tritonibacter mobilis]